MNKDIHPLFNEHWHIDRYAVYRQIRENNPVYRIDDTRYYLISRHQDIVEVLKQTNTFSSWVPSFIRQTSEGAIDVTPFPDDPEGGRVLAMVDPPIHTAQRRTLGKIFNKRVREVESALPEFCDRLVRGLPRHQPFDFMEQCARKVPAWATSTLLGFPVDQQDKVVYWAQQGMKVMSGTITDNDFEVCGAAVMELREAITEHYSANETSPEDSLTGDLAQLVSEGRLERESALGMLYQLVIGGADTTASWIGSTLLLLMLQPDAKKYLQNETSRAALLEETLRLEPPSQANYRVTTSDTTLSDTFLESGSILILLWGAANRDEAAWADPERIDVDRPSLQSHLSFSRGIHGCLGASLARAETQTLFSALAPIIASVRPVDDIDAPPWARSLFGRQLSRFNVSFDDG